MTATEVKRESVFDWLPPEIHGALGRLLTRDELIEHLKRRHVEVNAGNIRSWEHIGVLPLGVRRWRDGATRTLYPPASIYAILKLKELQALGLSLADARPEVRRFFAAVAIDQAFIAPEEKFRLRSTLDLRPPDRVIQTLSELADFHEAVWGEPIVRMRVELFDEKGHPSVYPLRKIDDKWKIDIVG